MTVANPGQPEQPARKPLPRWLVIGFWAWLAANLFVCLGLPLLNVLFGDAVAQTVGANDTARTETGVSLFFSTMFSSVCFVIAGNIVAIGGAFVLYQARNFFRARAATATPPTRPASPADNDTTPTE